MTNAFTEGTTSRGITSENMPTRSTKHRLPLPHGAAGGGGAALIVALVAALTTALTNFVVCLSGRDVGLLSRFFCCAGAGFLSCMRQQYRLNGDFSSPGFCF